ncbi:MAG: CBS domain-containing protein [Candidatus Limnocylindrales bacterium]
MDGRMICPVCHVDNIEGSDECENCGADLRAADLPTPETPLERRLVVDQLGDLEHRDPILLPRTAPAREAVAAMQQAGVGSVLVTDGDRLVGIFTERDALLKVAGMNAAALDAPLGELMTPDPVVLREDDSIAVAIHKMAVGGFRHIPLIRDGRPTGIVSARDVFGHVLEIIG